MAPQAPVGLSRPQAEMTLEDAVLAACSATGSDTIDLADLEAVA